MSQLTQEQIKAFKAGFPGVTEREPMSKHTTYRLGGPARLYLVADTSDRMVEAVQHADALNIPWYVYGGGSNLLVTDDGYEGLVIQAANRHIQISDETVIVESGMISALVARQTVEAGLTGFEWAIGLPGTIGGAIYGNGGCFGGEMRDAIVSVEAYRLKDHKRVMIPVAECQYGYRESLFKHERHVILGCTLTLTRATDPVALKQTFQETLSARKDQQPLDQSSAGCVFKNVEYTDDQSLDILRRSISEIPPEMVAKKRLGAGWLIDQLGLKGYQIGGVKVSDKHANFFVNTEKAKAQDVIALISYIKMKVRDELGIELQEEVQYLI
ncbi:UDP-N-acetylmuramate dehydrogenase [Candidatus Uhrbacteria bacterium]|nr:UDP-N-acetylmuramate dehydrogenase [Candidatus Uhrbacteria bacterium]